MDETWLRTWVVVASILQAIILVPGLKHAYRAGSWLIWIPSAILISCWLSAAASSPSWQMGSLDIAFLILAIPALLASGLLLLRKGTPSLLFWGVWLLNFALCGVFVGVAFFFKLQF